jgi:hypothetical protein
LVCIAGGIIKLNYGTHELILPVVVGEQYEKPPTTDLQFPLADDLINYTQSDNISTIKIPLSVIQERLNTAKDDGKLPWYHALPGILYVQNL